MLAAALLLPTMFAPVVLFRGAELLGQEIKYWNVDDTTLDSSDADNNLGGIAYLNGGSGKTILIRFGDLRRALGPGKLIKSAKLELTMTGADAPRMSSVSDVLVPWNEGPAFVVNYKALGTDPKKAAALSATYHDRRAGTEAIAWQGLGCSGIGDATPITRAKGALVGEGIFQITGIENSIQRTYDDPLEGGGLAIRFENACEFFSSQAAEGRPRLIVETEDKPRAATDLSVTHISRSPWPDAAPAGEPQVVDVDGKQVAVWPVSTSNDWPKAGDSITYTAHVKNVGTKAISEFSCRWSIRERWGGWADYRRALAPGESTTVTFAKPYKPDHKDHRTESVGFEVNQKTDENSANNKVEVPESGIDVLVAIDAAKASDPLNNRGSNAPEDLAQSLIDLVNRVVLPNSRTSFAPDGPRERFFIQGFVDAATIRARNQEPTNRETDVIAAPGASYLQPIRAVLSASGLSPISKPDGLAFIVSGEGSLRLSRPSPLAPSMFGGGESRFDGGLPSFLVMPPEPYSNPLFDNVVMESSGLLSITDVYGLESRLGVRGGAFGQYLYDQPALALFKAQAMDGRALKAAKVRVYAASIIESQPGPFLYEATTDASGAFNLQERKIPFAHPKLKSNILGVVDVNHPNEGLVLELNYLGQRAFAFLAPWQLTDMRARGGLNPVVFEIRFNVSDGAIGIDNLAKGRIVTDSARSLPARLLSLIDEKPETLGTFPATEAGWIEIDLGRDRVIGEVDLVFGDEPFWNDFDIAGYNTGQIASEAVSWRRERNFKWSRVNVAESEGSYKVVRYRAAAQQFRFLRIRNFGKAGASNLREIRVLGASAATPQPETMSLSRRR